jgi:hypothetical protein
MGLDSEPGTAGNASGAYREPQVLDDASIDVAALDVGQGAATPRFEPWRESIIQMLNDSPATELVCVLRYKRHYFTAGEMVAAKIAEEFLAMPTRSRTMPTALPGASFSAGASRTFLRIRSRAAAGSPTMTLPIWREWPEPT